MLYGRDRELRTLERLVDDAASGRGGAIVLRGGAGVGCTSLLAAAAGFARGFRVLRVVGVESEMDLHCAGVQQLCSHLLDQLDQLPPPQRDALSAALGLSEPAASDSNFLVALAVLTLLAESAEREPILCLVDDAHWIDDASIRALGFVARRLQAERIAMMFSILEPMRVPDLDGIELMQLGALDAADARTLFAIAVPGPIDPPVEERLIAETQGNPLAISELPYGLTSAQLAGGFGLPALLPPCDRIEGGYRRRVEMLPPETRMLLLVAAADPTGDRELLWRAAGRLGITADAAAPAEEARLLQIDGGVRFHHPLVRSAVYSNAPVTDRAAAHWALAEATDAGRDAERRAWHRAKAAMAPDDDLADELEKQADGAQSRGGLAAAAAFLSYSANLTTAPDAQAERRLQAARARFAAGDVPAAGDALARVDETVLTPPSHARAQLLSVQIGTADSYCSDGQQRLIDVATKISTEDAALARETYLEALVTAILEGRLGRRDGIRAVAAQCAEAPPAPVPARTVDRLLDGLVTRYLDGPRAAEPLLRKALASFEPADGARWFHLGVHVALELWDVEAAYRLVDQNVRLARRTGALGLLPLALNYLAIIRGIWMGRLQWSGELVDEANSICNAIGIHEQRPYAALMLAAWRGDAAALSGLIEEAREHALVRHEGGMLTYCEVASSILQNGLGNCDLAFEAARSAAADDQPGFGIVLTELVEAAIRSGHADAGSVVLERLVEQTGATPGFAAGMRTRCQALLAEDDRADELFGESVSSLEEAPALAQLARTHLLWGEALRRQGQRVEAREHLRIAHGILREIGAAGFADRADQELQATGERVRPRSDTARDELTAQERRIARLARDGMSNPEIASHLFISRRTVEYHLHKVFAKLGIRSRVQIGGAWPDDADGDASASGATASMEPAGGRT